MQGPDLFNMLPMPRLFQKRMKDTQKVKITPAQAKKILFFTTGKLVFIVIAPIALLILPKDFFDNGQSLCLSQLLFGVECPACGMTRGIMHLIHLDLENAFAYNMLSFIVLPLMIVVWIQWFFKETRIFRKLKAAVLSAPEVHRAEELRAP
jgi:hypothetical protein